MTDIRARADHFLQEYERLIIDELLRPTGQKTGPGGSEAAEDLPVDHVGLAVHSIRRHQTTLAALGLADPTPIVEIPEQGVRVSFMDTIELIEPLEPDTPVGRFLSRKGEGVHHLAYQVQDIAWELSELQRRGVRLIDSEPRQGAHGKIAFIHPEAAGGVLVELVERDEDD